MTLFDTGIRPLIDAHLLEEAEKVRNYGEFWSASSAGYCMRKNIFERLKIPHVTEDARTQRVFSSGHIFHEWIQAITDKTGTAVAQEIQLQDTSIMVKGHADDLIEVGDKLILYDYKTQNSRAFSYKRPEMSYYHKMQLGTYLYMLKRGQVLEASDRLKAIDVNSLNEARILKISKDDLRMNEEQLMYTPELEAEVLSYWNEINKYWKTFALPKCTCADREGGFMAKDKYNPFFYEGEPCSAKWYEQHIGVTA